MKSLPFYEDNRLGNTKMKGKKEKLLGCGCCVSENKKRYPQRKDLEKNFRILEEGPRK